MATVPTSTNPVSITGAFTARIWRVINTGSEAVPFYCAHMVDVVEQTNIRPEIHQYLPPFDENGKFQGAQYDMNVHGIWANFIAALQIRDEFQAEVINRNWQRAAAHVGTVPEIVNGTAFGVAVQNEPTPAEQAYIRRNNLHESDLGYDDSWS